MVIVLCYKFGYSLDYVLGLTAPQIRILGKNLTKICKAESGDTESNGESGEENKHMANRMAFAGTLKIMKEKTGRDNFSLDEMLNPEATIKKYKKV